MKMFRKEKTEMEEKRENKLKISYDRLTAGGARKRGFSFYYYGMWKRFHI